jgi:hypothetical protein
MTDLETSDVQLPSGLTMNLWATNMHTDMKGLQYTYTVNIPKWSSKDHQSSMRNGRYYTTSQNTTKGKVSAYGIISLPPV